MLSMIIMRWIMLERSQIIEKDGSEFRLSELISSVTAGMLVCSIDLKKGRRKLQNVQETSVRNLSVRIFAALRNVSWLNFFICDESLKSKLLFFFILQKIRDLFVTWLFFSICQLASEHSWTLEDLDARQFFWYSQYIRQLTLQNMLI